jgi:hypothetical protein
VQSDLGDIPFDRIQRAEFLDMAADTLREISSECRIWITGVEITPIPSLDYTYTTDADRLAATGFVPADVGKIAYVSDDDTWFRLDDDAPITWTQIDPYVAVIPASVKSQYLLAVKRNGLHAYEYSWQAVQTWNAEGYAFDINRTAFTGLEFNAKKNDDESVDLLFAYKFDIGEKVYVTVIASHPYSLLRWNETSIIPDFVEGTLSSGILMLALRRLMVQGDAKAAQTFAYIKDEYSRSFLKLKAYTRMFNDTRSSLIVQPINFLPE